MASVNFELKGMDDLLDRIARMEGERKQVVTEALTNTVEDYNATLDAAWSGYGTRTGDTDAARINDINIKWDGDQRASVQAGFQYPEGLAAAYLASGNPHRAPDQKLAKALKGTATKKKMRGYMEDALAKVVNA
jgi:hypothetical protein